MLEFPRPTTIHVFVILKAFVTFLFCSIPYASARVLGSSMAAKLRRPQRAYRRNSYRLLADKRLQSGSCEDAACATSMNGERKERPASRMLPFLARIAGRWSGRRLTASSQPLVGRSLAAYNDFSHSGVLVESPDYFAFASIATPPVY